MDNSNLVNLTDVPDRTISQKKWIDTRMPGKISFLISLMYVIITYSLLLSFPSIILSMYCATFPILFIIRIYSYIQSKNFLFLFDNCYFVNTALILYLWFDLPLDTFFLAIFTAVNGPVLWAVLPFRNTMAFHDLDKMTSCYIHWAPTIVTWTIRWFPAKTSFGWFRTFDYVDVSVSPVYQWHYGSDWFWLIVVPMGFLVVHDIIYALIVHVLIKPSEEYSDSFTYQRSKENVIGNSIQKLPERLQLLFYLLMSFLMYILGILVSILCYRMFLIHTLLICAQLVVMIWNGGCYYLDYFAYLALKAKETSDDRSNEKYSNALSL